MTATPVLLVYCTCPDPGTAETLAHRVLEKKLAACVNIAAPSRSVYRWRGKIEHADETLLSIKTTTDRYKKLEQFIQQQHPYDVPEIIALPIQHGLPDYLKWVEEECN